MGTLGKDEAYDGGVLAEAGGGCQRLKERAETLIEGLGVRSRPYFGYVHALMLLALVVVIVIPVFLPLPADEATAGTDFTVAARFIVWGLWFPLLFVSVIFFGRLWCGTLCPQGALSEYVSKFSLGRPVPGWLKWGGVPLLSFVFITIVGQVLGVRDYPLPAMAVFIGTTLLAVVVGLLYTKNRRVWCRYMCPVGPLLGVLSRLGAVSFEKENGATAATACPTFIKLSQKRAASHCIECFKCAAEVKEDGAEETPDVATSGVSSPGVALMQTGLRLRLRVPGKEIEEMAHEGPKREIDRWEVAFIFVATGLALGAFHWLSNPLYTDFKYFVGSLMIKAGLGDIIGMTGPWWTMVNYPASGEVFNVLDVVTILVFMFGFMAFVGVVLMSLTSISAFLIRRSGGDAAGGSFGDTTTLLGYQYAPVALVSLVLGLGLVLFDSLGSFGLSKAAIGSVEIGVFFFGAAWSAWLAVKLNTGALERTGPRARSGRVAVAALIPSMVGIGIIAALWHTVLF